MPTLCSSLPGVTTHRIDVRQAMDTLNYDEMNALANMYTRWALNELRLDGDQRTKLVELSSDYERVAAFVGESWKATNLEFSPDAAVFVARLELKDACERELNLGRAGDDGEAVPAFDDVSPDELYTDPAQYLLHLADTLCAALSLCEEEARDEFIWWFRKFAEDLPITCWGNFDERWVDEIRATLSPDNHQAMHWARQHVVSSISWPADASEPDSVISRLSWPIPPGGRARED